jgi:hypothetical protein
MAQNVRGQTLIDAIVQVFQDARGERALTADEVARRIRAGGFWGGKEPKAAGQMVASYLTTRHAGMFEPGAGGTFSLKSVFLRPAARAAVAASGIATAVRAETIKLRPMATSVPAGSRAAGAIGAGTPPQSAAAAPTDTPELKKRKKRKSFGGATVAYFTPTDVQHDALPPRINLHLSFEEAMKLHLSLGQLLGKLSGRGPGGTGRRKPAAKIRVDLAKHRISLFERPL